ncbi:MAG: DUF1080 domain-containing protein, partial [Planctomycetaceae bacterium]|nr:DUF1080 domain-containing protein [Planctomycetaceae bacterium]
DKTGSMNLEVRAQRLDESLSEQQKAALAARLAEKQTSVDVDLKPGQWHHIRVRIQGDTMEAWVADKKVASLKSPGIAHPTKTSFGFTVNGDSIEFDNVQAFGI